MEENQTINNRNSKLSKILIAVNLMLVFLMSITGKSDGDLSEILPVGYLLLASIILFGGFALTYKGKQHRWAKWFFGISIIAGILFFGSLWYLMQLGKAFQN